MGCSLGDWDWDWYFSAWIRMFTGGTEFWLLTHSRDTFHFHSFQGFFLENLRNPRPRKRNGKKQLTDFFLGFDPWPTGCGSTSIGQLQNGLPDRYMEAKTTKPSGPFQA